MNFLHLQNIILYFIVVVKLKTSQAQQLFTEEEYFTATNLTQGGGANDRDGRLFPLLTIVRLSNSICTSSNGDKGACKTRRQCLREGGIVFGPSCGDGYGVCCMLTKVCSASNNGQPITVTTSGTHLTHPSSYTPPLQCHFTIPRKPGVCQVRLDFVAFNLAQPNYQGDCDVDMMTITGADNLQNFVTCGMAAGQHLYLHYVTTGSISINFNLHSATAMYDILVTFIECGGIGHGFPKYKGKGRKFSNSLIIKPPLSGSVGDGVDNTILVEPAPFGCSQYYTKPSDTVQSFNFPMMGTNNGTTQFQINNQQYSVCVKSNFGSNRITWTTCNMTDSFLISGAAGGQSMMGGGDPSQCEMDYVDIPGSKSGRYCGAAFPTTPVTSSIKPYTMYVNFDGVEVLGLDLPVDPLTGCCMGFCTCFVDGIAMMPANPPPCNGQMGQCIINDYLLTRSDFYNTGFCLRYTLS